MTASNKTGTIEWHIESLKELDECELFPLNKLVLDNGEFSWDVSGVYRKKERNFVCFMQFDSFGKNYFQICKTEVKLEVKEKGSELYRELAKTGSYYWINRISERVLSTDAAKITAGSFPKVLRLHMEVTWAPRKESLPKVDAILDVKHAGANIHEHLDRKFHLDKQHTGGYIIPVNQQILASYSTYFRKLFFGPWKDEEKKPTAKTGDDGKHRFSIDEGQSADFGVMICGVQLLGFGVHELECLETTGEERQTTGEERLERCQYILNMAAKYELPMWLEYAEEMMINMLETKEEAKAMLELARSLSLSEPLNVSALEVHCQRMLRKRSHGPDEEEEGTDSEDVTGGEMKRNK